MSENTTTAPAPTPLFLAALVAKKQQVVGANLDPQAPAKVTRTHDGVVKTKHLEPGMEVQPYVHGVPRGSLRTVASVTKIDDGAVWALEFSSAHPDDVRKAAYRWYCPALDGKPIKSQPRVRRPRQIATIETTIGEVLSSETREALVRAELVEIGQDA